MTTQLRAVRSADLVEQLEEDGGSERAKREVQKWCHIVEKALLLFDGFLSLSWTDHKDMTPRVIAMLVS
jgi:hypothetical protein